MELALNYLEDKVLEIGKGKVICEGNHAAILNFGTRLDECKKAKKF